MLSNFLDITEIIIYTIRMKKPIKRNIKETQDVRFCEGYNQAINECDKYYKQYNQTINECDKYYKQLSEECKFINMKGILKK